MANPYIPLTKAALKADMTKNEGLIFMVLAMQTIGYRKATDNLTDKRLAQLTGIRLDHLRPSLDSFLDYGLFQRIEHKYYDYQYQLCDEFLDEGATTIIYPPSLPTKSASPETGETSYHPENLPDAGGDSAPRSVSFPDDGGHTTENPYLKNQQPTQTTSLNQKQQTEPKKNPLQQKQQTEPKKNTLQQQPEPAVTISMAGLASLPERFVIESTQPIRIEFSSENIGKAATIKPDLKKENVANDQPLADIIAEQTVPSEPSEPKVITAQSLAANDTDDTDAVPVSELSDQVTQTIADTVDDIESVSESSDPPNDSAANIAVNIAEAMQKLEIEPEPETETETETETVITPVTTPANKPKPVADLAVSVATSLVQSTTENEENPVVVNEEDAKKPLLIPKAVGEENMNACNRYFDLLTKAQKQDVLTVFFYNLKLGKIRNKASYFIGIAKKAETGKLTVPVEATAKPSTHQGPLSYEQHLVQKKKDKKHEAHLTLWADYTWIQRQAKRLKKSEEETAKMMGLEEAYALFSQTNTATQTQQVSQR